MRVNIKNVLSFILIVVAGHILRWSSSRILINDEKVMNENKMAPSTNISEWTWPKISPPPAIRRKELIETLNAISVRPCPNHTFPFPKAGGDKSYHFLDKNGRTFLIQPLVYEAMPYKGRSTTVFAWIGLPLEEDKREQKIPAMVLLHGSGGTAFKEWVELWVKRGYAAISIAVEGQTDEPLDCVRPKENMFYESTAQPGPRRHGVYRDWREPIVDHWMFHAVADTILARSLLADSRHVDPTKIGLMGISWGGIVACTVAGIVGRSTLFSHVIPAYGCGRLAAAQSQMGHALKENILYQILWDPCLYLSRAVIPSLWLSSPDDPKFPLDGFLTSSSMIGGPVMLSIIPNLGHGHEPIWNRPESYVFSENIWSESDNPSEAKKCWSKEISCEVFRSETNLLTGKLLFYTAIPFQYAKLIWSPDSDDSWAESRGWRYSDAQLTSSDTSDTVNADAVIPEEAKAWLINFYTVDRGDGELVVSSSYMTAKQYLQ